VTKPKKVETKVKVNIREAYHKAAKKAAHADGRRGLEVWIENAIISEAERQHDARKARK
jgi:predicted HicB family RNase H-like nuclease